MPSIDTTPSRPVAVRRAPKVAVLQASNAAVCQRDGDRQYGSLLVGGQGSGKTSVELRMYLNDVHDPNAAVIVIDPKSELSRLALRLTPPDCGKRVWFLDLGAPAFGMTPLRMYDDQSFALEAAAVADGIVESLLDVNQGQIFQASRDLLYRSVIAALAIAHHDGRPASFEDVYALLLPGRDDARHAAYDACARIPGLDQTAEFFRSELPDDLRLSTSGTADRLRAPRNKIAGIVGVPPLRRFLNHPVDLALRTIVEQRDVLIVDANMAAVGEANAEACLRFIFRLLHRQMQRQVREREDGRARVALICDEFHYLATRNIVKQIATHRAAGLDVTAGLQYLAQLGAGAGSAAITEEIRSGVVGLLQSWCLFRVGDPRDAEQAARVAMTVYQSAIRGDPRSRAQMRVTPDVLLNMPRHHCLASWIIDGSRAPAFVGRTYPMPHDTPETWAELHLSAQRRRVGEPDELGANGPSGIAPAVGGGPPQAWAAADHATAAANADGSAAQPRRAPVAMAVDGRDSPDRSDGDAAERNAARSGSDSTVHRPRSRSGAKPGVPGQTTIEEMLAADRGKQGPDVHPAPVPERPAASAVRDVVGLPAGDGAGARADEEAPAALRELAFIDRVNEVSAASDAVAKPEPLARVYDQDVAILKLLDRNGITLPALIAHAAMPGRSDSQVRRTLSKLHRHGLVARRTIGIRSREQYRGQLPFAYELTRLGFETAQARGAIADRRDYRPQQVVSGARLPHDHHALSWTIALHRRLPDTATDNWRTPRYATGRFPLPHTGNGHKRRPIAPTDVPLPPGQALFDVGTEDLAEIKPDVCCELYVRERRLRFDVLVEYHHHANLPSTEQKFRHYDAFLTGWCLAHPRFKQLGTRPVVVVVAAHARDMLALADKADRAMRGAIGVQGTAAQDWYYAGRDHVFFALEEDLHRGSLAALALPGVPPALRARLGSEGLTLDRVRLLSDPAR